MLSFSLFMLLIFTHCSRSSTSRMLTHDSTSGVPFYSFSHIAYHLLSENMAQPHCIEKFSPTEGPLNWPSTWRSLFLSNVDRPVIDLNWKIAHGMLYIAQRPASFRLPVPLPYFCDFPIASLDHLFFYCPLTHSFLSWLQALMFSYSSLCPALLLRHARFGFSSNELCVTPRIFVYLLNLCKFFVRQS